MNRTFTTSAEQDAAIAWRVAQLQQKDPDVTEAVLISGFVAATLAALVASYRDDEASRVFDAFKRATVVQRDDAKRALDLR